MAAMGAVLQFNEGASGKHLVMEKAGISHGELSVIGSAKKDQQRVQHSTLKASAKKKQGKKEDKTSKKEGRRGEEVIGRHYIQQGRFNDINSLDNHSSSKDDLPLAQVAKKKSKRLRKK